MKGELQQYLCRTHLLFSLESLSNFAKNGRVSPALAAIANLLGIRIVGRASSEGELEPLHKCRGEARALDAIVQEMADRGFRGGRVHIDHAENEAAAQQLCHKLRLKFPGCKPTVGRCGALCSYYAERGGLLVGCET